MGNHLLKWEEDIDEHDNSVWVANSCCDLGDQDFAQYRIKQVLERNKVWWTLDGSSEELASFYEIHPTLCAAKGEAEEVEGRILESFADSQDA